MSEHYALRDDQWKRIKGFLPGREGHVGGTASDNRLFVDAILYRYRTGIPWRSSPERFGKWKSLYQRWSRWAKSGVLEKIFNHVLLPLIKAPVVIADKGYDANERVIKLLEQEGKTVVIPPRSNRKVQRDYDRYLYKARHLIENFFCKLKQFRAIATRYDKTSRHFLAACTVWLN